MSVRLSSLVRKCHSEPQSRNLERGSFPYLPRSLASLGMTERRSFSWAVVLVATSMKDSGPSAEGPASAPMPIGVRALHTLAVETDTSPSRTIVPSVDFPQGLPAPASLKLKPSLTRQPSERNMEVQDYLVNPSLCIWTGPG